MKSSISRLDEVADVIDSLHKTPQYSDYGLSMVRATDVKYGVLNLDNTLKVDQSVFDEFSRRYKPSINDIVITRVGSYGITSLVKDTNFCLGQNTSVIIPKINPRYLYAAINSPQIKNQIEYSVVGSTQKTLSLKAINSLEIPRFQKYTEDKIAHIVSTLDDKIELNRKMNQTLEAMAQALFKSWFVDFDPVHAKAKCNSDEELETAAKKLGISKEILELFPSEFEESELGMIPKGWEVKPLSSIAHYQNGLALQKFRPLDESNYLPVLKISQLNKGYTDGEEKADINIKPECIVDSGDIVFSWSGTLIVDIWCGGKAALNQHLFKVTSKDFPKWFYYYWTKQHLFWFQHIAESKAVTMGHIKRSHLDEALCCIPTESVFIKAEDLIGRLVEKTISNRLEIQTLQKTRDTLLPKLLSGELDVSELELKI